MKKKVWIIIITTVVILVVAVALWVRFAPASMLLYFQGREDIVSNTLCSYPVRVVGDSMTPTFKGGELINFNKCFDKDNLLENQIIIFKSDGPLKIGIIRKIQKDDNAIKYIVSPEAREGDSSEIFPDDIIAVYKKQN